MTPAASPPERPAVLAMIVTTDPTIGASMVHPARPTRTDLDTMPVTEPLALPIFDAAPMPVRAVWIQVESGLHVANTDATFIGTVTATGSGFETMDGAGRRRGTFITLAAAKGALEACADASGADHAPARGPLAPVM